MDIADILKPRPQTYHYHASDDLETWWAAERREADAALLLSTFGAIPELKTFVHQLYARCVERDVKMERLPDLEELEKMGQAGGACQVIPWVKAKRLAEYESGLALKRIRKREQRDVQRRFKAWRASL